jgi:hypothetical protein
MLIRVFIAVFSSFVAGFSYLTGLGRLMTGLLLGFGAFSSIFLGLLFILPIDTERAFLPVFLIGAILVAMIVALFLVKGRPAREEQVSAVHFKYLVGGIGGYLASLFGSSVFWFPSDARRAAAAPSTLTTEALAGTCLFLVGVSFSCYMFYRASKGTSGRHPDLMRRFVLGFFAFFQFDKMPLLVAYLLISSPQTQVNFPNIAALTLASYIPVAIFLLQTIRGTRAE